MTITFDDQDTYSEITVDKDPCQMFVTATDQGLDFYCNDKIEEEVASMLIPWTEVPQFMEYLNALVAKWKPQ